MLMAVSDATLRLSFTPVMLALSLCEAVVLPSVTDRVKSSPTVDLVPSIAFSSGT